MNKDIKLQQQQGVVRSWIGTLWHKQEFLYQCFLWYIDITANLTLFSSVTFSGTSPTFVTSLLWVGVNIWHNVWILQISPRVIFRTNVTFQLIWNVWIFLLIAGWAKLYWIFLMIAGCSGLYWIFLLIAGWAGLYWIFVLSAGWAGLYWICLLIAGWTGLYWIFLFGMTAMVETVRVQCLPATIHWIFFFFFFFFFLN